MIMITYLPFRKGYLLEIPLINLFVYFADDRGCEISYVYIDNCTGTFTCSTIEKPVCVS